MIERGDELSREQRRSLVRQAEIRAGLPPSSDRELDMQTAGVFGSALPRQASEQRAYPFEEGAGASSSRDFGGGDDPKQDERASVVMSKQWALARCLVLRAESMMLLPIRFYRGTGEDREEVLEGPLFELFDKPNPEYGWSSLLAMLEMSLNTSKKGAFAVLDGFDSAGYPTEIWWADPSRMSPKKAKKGQRQDGRVIDHYEYAAGSGRKQKFPREQVIWFRLPTGRSDFGSSPILDSALGPAILAMKAMKSNMLLHDNAMTGAGIIHPGDGNTWTDEQMKEVQRVLQRTLIGGGNWKRLGMMNRGDFDVKDLQSFNPKDAQFTQLMKLSTEQICIATGVPLPLIQPTDSTFSNAGESRGMLWSNTLIPRSLLIASTIRRQLADIWFEGEADAVELCTSFIPELQENLAERWTLDAGKMDKVLDLAGRVRRREIDHEAAVAIASFYIGLPEDKALQLIPPAPEAEEASEVKISAALVREYFAAAMLAAQGALPRATVVKSVANLFGMSEEDVSSMLGEVGDSFVVKPPEESGQLAAPELDQLATPPVPTSSQPQVIVYQNGRSYRVVERAGEATEASAPTTSEIDALLEYGSDAHVAYMRKAEDEIADHHDRFLATVVSLFGDQASEVEEALGSLDEGQLERWATDFGDDADGIAEAIMSALFNALGWIETSQAGLLEDLMPLALDVGTALFEEVGATGDFDVEDAEITSELEHRAAQFAIATVDTNRGIIGSRLAKGVLEGRALRDLVKDVQEVGEQLTGSRAEMVALTEVHSASVKVAEVAARQSGVVTGRQWISSLDDRVRKTHRDAHGQTVGIDERYQVGDTECDSPGNCDDASEVYRCRCVERFVTRSQRSFGLPEVFRRIRGGGESG